MSMTRPSPSTPPPAPSRRRPVVAPTVALLAAAAVGASWLGAQSAPRPAISGTVAGGPQAPAVRVPADAPRPDKTAPRLDSRLVRLQRIARQQGAPAARRFARDNAILLDADGDARLLVHQSARATFGGGVVPAVDSGAEEAVFAALEEPVARRIRAAGGEVVGRRKNLVEARVPATRVAELGAFPEIAWVQPAPRPFATQLQSQGVAVTGAGDLQGSPVSYGAAGTRVRVGVLDTGFLGHAQLLGTELPSGVTTNSFHAGGISAAGDPQSDRLHGTATAEIVHDMAPDADLFLVNFDSLANNGNAVDWLIDQGVDVISYSVGWFNAGPGDGRGPVNDDVQRALGAGIEWASSAGNDAKAHWQGTYRDRDGNSFHDFTGADETNSVFLATGDSLIVFLSWDDWFESDQDYDLLIFDENFNLVASSANFQTGTQWPVEAAGVTALQPTTVHVAINRFSATRNVDLEAFFIVPRQMQYIVPAGSLGIPADTEGAVAVGATFWSTDNIEPFSSLGPTTDGRIKPDIAAPDGTASVTFGQFFGTSASTPHVAGAMALVKSRFGVYTLDDIRRILLGRALDRGPAGRDNEYGEGRLDVRGQD